MAVWLVAALIPLPPRGQLARPGYRISATGIVLGVLEVCLAWFLPNKGASGRMKLKGQPQPAFLFIIPKTRYNLYISICNALNRCHLISPLCPPERSEDSGC